MPRIHGKAGSVKIDSDSGGNAEALTGINSWSIDYKGAADESTGIDSSGKKAFLAGLTEWSGSFSSLWDTTETDINGGDGDPPLLAVGTRLELELWADDTVNYVGDAIITSFKPEVQVDGVVKISVDFQGTEALT